MVVEFDDLLNSRWRPIRHVWFLPNVVSWPLLCWEHQIISRHHLRMKERQTDRQTDLRVRRTCRSLESHARSSRGLTGSGRPWHCCWTGWRQRACRVHRKCPAMETEANFRRISDILYTSKYLVYVQFQYVQTATFTPNFKIRILHLKLQETTQQLKTTRTKLTTKLNEAWDTSLCYSTTAVIFTKSYTFKQETWLMLNSINS